MSILSGLSMFLLGRRGWSQAEVKRETQKMSSFYQYKINIVMPDKCGIGKARNLPIICALQFLFEQGCKKCVIAFSLAVFA